MLHRCVPLLPILNFAHRGFAKISMPGLIRRHSPAVAARTAHTDQRRGSGPHCVGAALALRRQHARLAVEITEPFDWPSDADSSSIEKLRDFVKQRLQNVGEFVLFDEANHRQLELPSGWDQLAETSEESD